jgi:uncharacterized protein
VYLIGRWLIVHYNASGLLKDQVGSSREFTVEDQTISTAEDHFTDVSGYVDLLKTGRGILVQAEVTASTIEECSRCLKEAEFELEVEFEEEFRPVNRFSGMIEADDESPPDFDYSVNEDNTIDFRESFRQAFVSAIPMAPLCKPECKGLCSECSIDLNLEDCDCNEIDGLPEWAASLKSLEIN